MKKKLPFYIVININNFDINLYATKSAVEKAINCNRLPSISPLKRITVNEYIIIPVMPIR